MIQALHCPQQRVKRQRSAHIKGPCQCALRRQSSLGITPQVLEHVGMAVLPSQITCHEDIPAGQVRVSDETVLDASASAFGHKAEKLHRAIFNEIRSYRRLEIYARACELSRDDPRRRAFLGAAEDKVSLQFFTGTPMPRCRYTAQEFHSSAQNALGLPQSRLKSILGRPITNNANCPTARVDAYGHSFKNRDGRQIRRHQAAPRPPREPAFKVAPPS